MKKAHILVGVLLAFSFPAKADPADFYRGKVFEVLAGSGPGGSYDSYARALAMVIGRHIPGNPSVVTKNVVGAGTFRLASFLENAAPKDGLAIGNMSSAVVTGPLFNAEMKAFNPRRLTWIGSAAAATYVCVTDASSKIKTFQDLLSQPSVFGAIGPTDNRYIHAAIMKNLFDAPIKIISGYPGSNELRAAIDKGEVEGQCGDTLESIRSTKPDWITGKKINFVVQFRPTAHADLATVPVLIEKVKSEDDRGAISLLTLAASLAAMPFAAAPDIPADRTTALRQAFDLTMKDPEYIAFAKRAGLDIDPKPGQQVAQFIDKLYELSPSHVMRAQQLVK